MTEYVYKVLTEDVEEYWVSDPYGIISSFGTVVQVTKYLVTNPEDITDAINGEYYKWLNS
jgi:hypothetical protein